jgi:YebC/PmpR family DNA-binding regulatory protein
MSGHSKWSKIKRQKGATDATRSKVFSKYARLITLESKKHAGSMSAPSLATVLARAKAANMPKDSMDRAVAKGISKDAGDLSRVAYETYGPGGCAVIVSALTDNSNRTTQEVKHVLSKNGYELGAQGSAAWAFVKQPDGTFIANQPLVTLGAEDEEKLVALLDALDDLDDTEEVFTNADGFDTTRED